MLSEQIGRRPTGSQAYDDAVEYAAGLFEGWGYAVEVQEFTATAADVVFLTTVDVTSPEALEAPAVAFDGSAPGVVSGRLVDAGGGLPAEFPVAAEGAVVLLQRGEVFFSDMAAAAEDAGAIAMVVANSEGGIFRGELGGPSSLPAVGIPLDDGARLRDLIAAGNVEVTLEVPSEIAGSNVIARPESGLCRTVSGGHLDSVPWAPGANDNASGSALVLELARAAAVSGLDGHCFALFDTEENGLFGSSVFVSKIAADAREAFEAYFNFDVVASNGGPLILGSSDLLDEAEALAGQLAIEVQRGQLPRDVGSDHISFLDAGLPALMLTTPDFMLIHTPQDVVANLDPVFLQDLADLGFALLQAHGPDAAATPSSRLPGARP